MLDIVVMQQCDGVSSMNIGGYHQGNLGTEQPYCTCKGFQFRKNCKHLKEALEKKCEYHEQIHGKPKINGICPFCGSPTKYVRVGI